MFRLRLAGRSGLPRLEDLNLGSRQPVLYRPTGRFFKPTMLRLCFFSRRRPRFFVSCMQYINCTILHICRRCTLQNRAATERSSLGGRVVDRISRIDGSHAACSTCLLWISSGPFRQFVFRFSVQPPLLALLSQAKQFTAQDLANSYGHH